MLTTTKFAKEEGMGCKVDICKSCIKEILFFKPLQIKIEKYQLDSLDTVILICHLY